jgi:hypothetical protein
VSAVSWHRPQGVRSSATFSRLFSNRVQHSRLQNLEVENKRSFVATPPIRPLAVQLSYRDNLACHTGEYWFRVRTSVKHQSALGREPGAHFAKCPHSKIPPNRCHAILTVHKASLHGSSSADFLGCDVYPCMRMPMFRNNMLTLSSRIGFDHIRYLTILVSTRWNLSGFRCPSCLFPRNRFPVSPSRHSGGRTFNSISFDALYQGWVDALHTGAAYCKKKKGKAIPVSDRGGP